MDPASIAMLILQAAPMLAGPIAQAIPGPMEEQLRKDVDAERQALQTWQGGMSAAQRDRLRNEGLSGLQAQQQAQLSALARGAAQGDGGTIGMQANAARDVARLGAGAQNQLESGVRQQDVDLYNLRRRQNRADIEHAIELGWRRKQAALQAAGVDTGFQQGESQGQADRMKLASMIAGGYKSVDPASVGAASTGTASGLAAGSQMAGGAAGFAMP